MTGGRLFALINRQLGLGTSVLILAASRVLIPYATSIALYNASHLVAGVATSGIDVAANAWLLEIWGTQAGPYMQGMHAFFSLGAFIAPIIAKPFLSEEHESLMMQSANPLNSTTNGTTLDIQALFLMNDTKKLSMDATTTMMITATRVHIPYVIVSCITMSASALIFLLYFTLPYKELTDDQQSMRKKSIHSTQDDPVIETKRRLSQKMNQRVPESEPAINSSKVTSSELLSNFSTYHPLSKKNPDSEESSGGKIGTQQVPHQRISDSTFYILSVMFVSIVFCFAIGAEMNTIHFLTAFIEAKGYGKITGVQINSCYLAAFTIGRFVNIFLATILSNLNILYMCLFTIGLSNILAMIFRDTSVVWMWITMTLLGLGEAATSPAIYSYVKENIKITTWTCGIFVFSSSVSTSMNPLVIGHFIDSYPNIFILYNLFSFVLTALSMFMFHLLVFYKNMTIQTVTSHSYWNLW